MSKQKFEFRVFGKPATAGSKKGFYNKKLGRVLMVPDNKKQKPWMEAVKQAFLDKYSNKKPIMAGPVDLTIYFWFHRPKNHFRTGKNSGNLKEWAARMIHKPTKPDLSKLVRAVEDALTGLAWRDDAQVTYLRAYKFYCRLNNKPRVTIIIEGDDNE